LKGGGWQANSGTPAESANFHPEVTQASLQRMTVAELKEQLETHGLPTAGKKSELVLRLNSAVAQGTGTAV